MDDVAFASVRWVAVVAYVGGCAVAVLTAGSLVPGVDAPQLLPGITSLNGIVAAALIHAVGYYTLERTRIVAGHAVDDDAEYV